MSQARRPSSHNRPHVSRPGPGGLRFGMFAVCVSRDSDPGLNKGKAKNLYHLLITYADVSSRNTAQGYPYRSALADALDCTKDTVDNATKYLEQEIGLIRVVRRKVEGQPDQNDANEYQVFDQWLIQGCEPTPDTPPQLVARYGATVPGFDVEAWLVKHAPSFDLEGWRAAYEEKLRAQEAKRAEQRRKEALRRKPKRKGGSGTHSATRGGTKSATGGGMSAALSTSCSPEPSSRDEEAPSGRSPAGVRSTSTSGSSELEAASGSAAAGTDSSSSDEEDGTAPVPGQRKNGPELSKEEMAKVRAVEALLPPALVAKLPYQQLPGRNRPVVLEALESRTVEQLRERVERRWLAYGYEPALHDGTLTSPVGAAVELIVPPRYCPDLSCEDGWMIDTGEECRACLERQASRRAARAAGQPLTSSSKGRGRLPECVICQAPFPGAVPDDGECLTCRKKAEAAMEALKARLDASDAAWPAWAVQEESGSAEADEEDGVDEETARLRAQLARQFGTREQVAEYCTEAPF
ncbi:hypothetical protein AB0900_31380 [Streptomyces cellulosae]